MVRLAVLVAFMLTLSGCTFGHNLILNFRIHHAVSNRDYTTAMNLLKERCADDSDPAKALSAAREGAHVAHILARDYSTAIQFYKRIIILSEIPRERLNAERAIAQIDFENLKDYQKATAAYEELLRLDPSAAEKFSYHLNVVKSQYRMNNLNQALIEVNALLEQKLTPDQSFKIKVLKANILVARKQLVDAAALWEDVIAEYPTQSKRDKVALNLLVCYEELKQFDKAIAVLKKMRTGDPHPDFIDAQIKRLKELQINQPGASGLRR